MGLKKNQEEKPEEYRTNKGYNMKYRDFDKWKTKEKRNMPVVLHKIDGDMDMINGLTRFDVWFKNYVGAYEHVRWLVQSAYVEGLRDGAVEIAEMNVPCIWRKASDDLFIITSCGKYQCMCLEHKKYCPDCGHPVCMDSGLNHAQRTDQNFLRSLHA